MRFRDVKALDVSNGLYHASPWDSLSASRLSVFRDNPQAYYQQFISGEMAKRDTPAMLQGRTIHEVILEQPIQFDRTNWHAGTLGTFAECRTPTTEPDETVTREGMPERIWYRETPMPGVIRSSRNWGDIENSSWQPSREKNGEFTGFCAFEDFLLDGHGFRNIPDEVLSSTGDRRGSAWKEWSAANAGQTLLKYADWKQYVSMRREIREHAIARELLLLGEGGTEYSLSGIDTHYDIEVRTRIDRWRIHNGAVYVSDLKTAADATPRFWSMAAIRMKLYVQAFIMSRLAAEHFQKPVFYRYVVIDKSPPYRCEVFEVEPELIEIGQKQYDADLAEFVQCRDSGIWRPKSHGKLNTIHTPRWMMQDAQMSWKDTEDEYVPEYVG